jgi:hypothetical protein
MEQNPSREANRFLVNKFLACCGNPKVHYPVYKSPHVFNLNCNLNKTLFTESAELYMVI